MAKVIWKNISILRGVAICLVILAHSLQKSGYYFYSDLEKFSPLEYPIQFGVLVILRSLIPFCLPAFLFASGFIFYRVYQGWRSATTAFIIIIRKYLIWSIPLFLLLSLKNWEFNLFDIILGIVMGGPMDTYWFLVLIAIIYLIAPIWVNLVNLRPLLTIFLVMALQVGSWILFYSGYSVIFHSLIESLFIRPLIFLPSFVVGLLLSSNIKAFMPFLNNRRLLVGLTLITALLCISESIVIGFIYLWDTSGINRWFDIGRISIFFFFIFFSLLIITTETKWNIMAKWFYDVGLASLGILFLVDIFLNILDFFIWHAPAWIYPSKLTLYNHGIPIWLRNTSFWLLPIFFCFGLFGPLSLMKCAKKIFGNRVRFLW